ncbi:uncharacterized protein LOC113486102 [Athene cunicularia]|uniref:uncharacterized protein LOC113486102 n=1 Tax=Athene cunicularia TaxID=194338 RepID=UPI000EF68AA5|nr:uncharacterized protein LOC113486102 [Athene cunicularia]
MAGLNPGVGASQGCGVVLLEIGQADGGDLLTPAAQGSSVRSHVSPPVDRSCHGVKTAGDAGGGAIHHRDMQVPDVGTEGVRHLQGDVDDGADAVGEEQEVAVCGHHVTGVEVGGDPGCWGKTRRAPTAATIEVCWLCLEMHVEIHSALSPTMSWPTGPHCPATLAGGGVAMPPHGNRHHAQRQVATGPWRSGAVRGLASPSSHHPRAGSSSGLGAGLGGPHTGWGTPHAVLGLWEQVRRVWISPALHPALRDMKPPLTHSSSADVDLDEDSPLLNSSLPSSTHRPSCNPQLLLEKKIKHFEEAKKKTERFYKHLKQQFLKEQERKMAWRKKASERFEKSLEVFSRRSGKLSTPSAGGFSVTERTPLEHAAAPEEEGIKRHV